MTVRLTLTEEMLGTASANPEIHSEYIASKAPDAMSMEEEVAAIGAAEVEKKAMTVFPRDAAKHCGKCRAARAARSRHPSRRSTG